MAIVAPPVDQIVRFPLDWSLADLVQHLGEIGPDRIRLHPRPGTATPHDVEQIESRENRLFELVDGVLVEKPMGWYESVIALWIGAQIVKFLEVNNLGRVLGADGSLRILSNQVRLPDVCFISWERFPKQPLPRTPIPQITPDLAVEVLSQSNTAAEMDRKLQEYFQAGVKLVWYIDPATRTATVYTAVDQVATIVEHDQEHGFLEGRNVLPGLRIPLAEVFAYADQQGPSNHGV